MLQICPTDIIQAPADRVWHVVVNPLELAKWTDTRLLGAPQRDVRTGDRLDTTAAVGSAVTVLH